ncbi:MAG: uracil-DNA glycosylase family protein [Pirellulales bacterium]
MRPAMLVCLGATAAQALLGGTFRITQDRGKVLATAWSSWTMATYHPSAVLRAKSSSRGDEIEAAFVNDLRNIATAYRALQ